MATVTDPYRTLGVDRKATDDEIKKAYRKLARQYHPDRNPGDAGAEDRFKEVQEAYSILSDPEKRRSLRLGRRRVRLAASTRARSVVASAASGTSCPTSSGRGPAPARPGRSAAGTSRPTCTSPSTRR